MTRGSSIIPAPRTARRSTIASASSSRRSRRSRRARSSCTTTSTSAATITRPRTRSFTSAAAGHRRAAEPSSRPYPRAIDMTAPVATLRALVRRLVDYAGLYPPASLSMEEATRCYASHLASPDAWMLGRFVVPVERLGELAEAATPLAAQGTEAWRVSALVRAGGADAGASIRNFNSTHRGRFVVDVIECRALAAGSVARSIGALPGELRIFVELPLLDDPRAMLTEIRAAGAWAKIRTGGVSADAFPASREVSRFIARAAELFVPFKATAGLHHPVCGEYPLTYDAEAPRGRMFGFLNIFAAAVFAHARVNERMLTDIVNEDDPSAFRFAEDVLVWHGQVATTKQITSARSSLGLAFGSCSFQEPVDGLRELQLL